MYSIDETKYGYNVDLLFSRDRKTEAIAELERELELMKQALQKSQQEVRKKCVCVCVNIVACKWIKKHGSKCCEGLRARCAFGYYSLVRKWS